MSAENRLSWEQGESIVIQFQLLSLSLSLIINGSDGFFLSWDVYVTWQALLASTRRRLVLAIHVY